MRGTKGDYYDYRYMNVDRAADWMEEWAKPIAEKKEAGDTRYVELVAAYDAMVAAKIPRWMERHQIPDNEKHLLDRLNKAIEAVYDELEASIHWSGRPIRWPGEYR